MSETSLDISVQSLKRVDIITVAGRVDSTSAPKLDAALGEILGNGRYHLALDLSQVNYMSSAGLRAMVSALRECKKHGGDVRLSPPSERVAEVLELAGLDSLFTTFDDMIETVGSF